MKLAMCSLHEKMPCEFPCLAIRHDYGRKATPKEVWEWAMSLDSKAREECAEICDRIGGKEMTEDGIYIAKECASAIRDTIQEG